MPHDHPAQGHNHATADHLHSHLDTPDRRDDLQALADAFLEGFRTAADKAAYLDLARIPREIPDLQGGAPLKLVDVQMTTSWQVGTASPAFGTAELSYLPYPGAMIRERTDMGFVYVSLTRRETMDLLVLLADRPQRPDGSPAGG